MGSITKIQFTLGKLILSRKASRVKRNTAFVNLASAENIGVIYKHRSEKDLVAVSSIKDKLQATGKKVIVLGWISSKDIPAYLVTSDMGFFFNRKDLNRFLIPKSDYVKGFINNEFDILLNLDVANSFVIQYVVALSKSKMRVGRADESINKYLDFMINLDAENNSIMEIFNQVWHYLSMIKSA